MATPQHDPPSYDWLDDLELGPAGVTRVEEPTVSLEPVTRGHDGLLRPGPAVDVGDCPSNECQIRRQCTRSCWRSSLPAKTEQNARDGTGKGRSSEDADPITIRVTPQPHPRVRERVCTCVGGSLCPLGYGAGACRESELLAAGVEVVADGLDVEDQAERDAVADRMLVAEMERREREKLDPPLTTLLNLSEPITGPDLPTVLAAIGVGVREVQEQHGPDAGRPDPPCCARVGEWWCVREQGHDPPCEPGATREVTTSRREP